MRIAPMAHDAEWMLQHELLINDLIAAQDRRRGPRQRERSISTVITSEDPTGDEVAGALRMLDRIAAAKGLDRAARAEVLEALGLTATTPVALPRRKRSHGKAAA